MSILGLSSLLPACSCIVGYDRSPEPGDGLFSGLDVGGTKSDGLFVLALRESSPLESEATLVSLGDEPWMCSLGPATWYETIPPGWALGLDVDVTPGPVRFLALDGEEGESSGTLRLFDAVCQELLQVPAVEAPVVPVYGDGPELEIEGYTALTTDGSLLWIDPWAPSVRTLAEHVSQYRITDPAGFWIWQDGALVQLDRDGNALTSIGSGITELAWGPYGTEVAFVADGRLFAVTLDDPAPSPIATEGVPCKLQYMWLSDPTLTYRDDCALGDLAILNRSTGEKRIVSSAVTDVEVTSAFDGMSFVFVREPPGGERELWASMEGSEPVLVGLRPHPALYLLYPGYEYSMSVILDFDGETGTLGTWTPDGGFEPLLERVGWFSYFGRYLTAVADREGDIGTLLVLDSDTHAEALRVEDVHWRTVRSSYQAPLLGYVRDWDSALGAGTFEVWIQPFNQKVVVDEGVSEFLELDWPKRGVLYAVRTPGREGLWTAYPNL